MADGDRSAFDTVYKLAWPRVRALAHKLLDGDEEAEDVAQQALLAVFERASEYSPERGRALPWVLGITGWTVKTHRKRMARRGEVGLSDAHPCARDTEASLVERDLLRAVRATIGRMSELDQATLVAGLEETGAGPVYRKRLQRALERLRTRWWRTHGA